MPTPWLYRAEVLASTFLIPFKARHAVRQLRATGIPTARAHETLGHATQLRRGSGPLIWFHGPSDEAVLAVLALIHRMGIALPRAQFLITSDKAASDDLIATALPPRTVHQFAPLEAPGPLNRFLKHWRPDAAIMMEGDLRPQMIRQTHAAGTRMGLVNPTLSPRRIAGWQKRPAYARHIFDAFDLILAPTDADAQTLVDLHAPPAHVARGTRLRAMSYPTPVDKPLLAPARDALHTHPRWVATATYPGEEEVVLAAHKVLLRDHPELCLILAPQDPKRGTEVVNLIAGAGLSLTRRTRGDAPGGQVYLADTQGEDALWHQLSDIVFLGGSLQPIGGHNPFNVAMAGAFTLSGNHITQFADTYAELEAAGASRIIADADDLAAQVQALLDDPAVQAKAARGAQDFVEAQADKLDRIAERLIKALGIAL